MYKYHTNLRIEINEQNVIIYTTIKFKY